ncbi:MAG: hypothetical protein ACPG19_07450 [Saprospiraceae bacterium]
MRYHEFFKLENGKIVEMQALWDIPQVMMQANAWSMSPSLAVEWIVPSLATNDGIITTPYNETQGNASIQLVMDMLKGLERNNEGVEAMGLDKYWHPKFNWYGSAGIGASYTIPRYQEQHQLPFRENLTDKVFNGHIARFSEGNYAGFFGWPNLNNKNKGGFLGLPASDANAPMRVVDIYRREGDKLAENWVYIDILHYLYEQGLDVLKRMRQINRTIGF